MAQRSAMVRDYGSARFVAHLKACSQRPDRTALLAASACPVLVVAARDDRVIPADLQRATVQAMPHARFVEIADAGHMMPLEQPAALAQALRTWITSAPLQP
jgi:pimeloyl-ACP methyl ester carboxylesterase